MRIYVIRKRVPPKRRLPRTIQGLPVDAVAGGKVKLSEAAGAARKISRGDPAHIAKFTPLEGGISVCNAKIAKCGTLGYFLRDDQNPPPPPKKPQWYILSCAHVLQAVGLKAGAKQEIMQPSPKDKGKYPHDLVGELTSAVYTPVDAGIAKIDIGAVSQIVGIVPSPPGNKVVTETMVKSPGNKRAIRVEKSGRTTGVTSGWIIDGHYRLGKIKYPDGSKRDFEDCLLLESDDPAVDFQLGGDSGALLVDAKDGSALGLLFASWPMDAGTGSQGIACRMEKVLAAFPGKIIVKPGERWP